MLDAFYDCLGAAKQIETKERRTKFFSHAADAQAALAMHGFGLEEMRSGFGRFKILERVYNENRPARSKPKRGRRGRRRR